MLDISSALSREPQERYNSRGGPFSLPFGILDVRGVAAYMRDFNTMGALSQGNVDTIYIPRWRSSTLSSLLPESKNTHELLR